MSAESFRRWAEERGKGDTPRAEGSARPAAAPAATPRLEPRGVGAPFPDFTVLDIETTGREPWSGELVCVGVGDKALTPGRGRGAARRLLARPGVVACHTNYDLRWLVLDGAVMHDGLAFHDTKVMAWLLDVTQELGLDALAQRYLGYTPPKLIRVRGGRVMFESPTVGLVPIEEAPRDEVHAYNESDLSTTAELYETLRQHLEREGMWEHFLEEEAPFSKLLVEMEVAGIPFDRRACEDLLEVTTEDKERLRAELIGDVGAPDFNPGSAQQVGDFLYSKRATFPVRFAVPRLTGMAADAKMDFVQGIAPEGVTVERVGREYAYGAITVKGRGLKPPPEDMTFQFGAAGLGGTGKKRASGRPTVSARALRLLYADDPWVQRYLDWKGLEKLTGTFLSRWLEQEHDGRIHARFDQAGTVTGRLSNREPNLQQVPATNTTTADRAGTKHAGSARALFAGDLVVGDYSGLEVRVSAHLSGDPVMLEAFREGKDLYGMLAARAWGGPETKDNPGRKLMKTLILSSQYGAQAAKLAFLLDLAGFKHTPKEAGKLLAMLRELLPRLFEWREETIYEARKLGYVETIDGRRRHLPGAHSASWKEQSDAERQAVNGKVQGSAAAIARRAMLRSREEFDPAEARLLVQVHDEMMWERGPLWGPGSLERLVECCETGHGFELEVPIVFEAKEVASWAEKGDVGGVIRHGEFTSLEEAAR